MVRRSGAVQGMNQAVPEIERRGPSLLAPVGSLQLPNRSQGPIN